MQHREPAPVKSAEDKKKAIAVKHQVVAGFVIFRKTDEGIKFLQLYRRGHYSNFHKRHFEVSENSLGTALRETKEETGLGQEDLHIIPAFRAYEKFNFQSEGERIHDTVILYLAETKKAQVIIEPREHSGFGWFTYHDALRVLGKKYVATQRVLKQASDFLRRAQGERKPNFPRRPMPPAGRKPFHRNYGPRPHAKNV